MSYTVAPAASHSLSPIDDKSTVPITLTDAGADAQTRSPKSRKRAASSEGLREDIKKQRGRPRVEPKDETAADRRRTQIRLAQRTYRARKESTITYLEDKVARLESRLSCSTAGYRELYNLALSDNLANTNPTLFDALSRFAHDMKPSSDYDHVEPQSAGYEDPSRSFVAESMSSSSSEVHEHRPRPNVRTAGTPSAESSPDEVIPVARTLPPGVSVSGPTDASAAIQGTPGVWSYEVAYEPPETDPRAVVPHVYPAYMNQGANPHNFGPLPPSQTFQMAPPSMQSHVQSMPPDSRRPSVLQELAPPRTNAHLELTFGRYFHRRCLEYAYTLLSSPQKYQKMIDQVFAHALQYSSQEAIRDRMKHRVHLSVEEDLDAPIPYQTPSEMDQDGRWFKPTDIEDYFKHKGIHLHPRANLLEYVVFDEQPPNENHMMWNAPQAAPPPPSPAAFGQIVGPPATYQSMPGMYVDHMGQAYAPPGAWTPSAPAVRRKKITVDVNKLVSRLLKYSKCRGRTPAVRQQDVDSALHRSILTVQEC